MKRLGALGFVAVAVNACGNDVCEGADSCQKWGQCVQSRGRCVAMDDEACRASVVCAEYGECVARDGVCIADNDVDCRRTKTCREL
ncbi:MAG: hypothetical protein MUF54_04375, partial [Polyangiaceae bacterium]|nr:hypothetical protein [Polyangiaceae bacterium]